MASTAPTAVTWRQISALVSALAVLAIVAIALEVLLLLFIGVVLGVFLAETSVNAARQFRIPRLAALAGIIVIGVAAGGLFLLNAGPQIADQLQTLIERAPEFLDRAIERIQATGFGADALDALRESARSATENPGNSPLLKQGAGLVQQVAGIFSTTFGLLMAAIVVIAISLYIAVEPAMYRGGVLAMIPSRHRDDAEELLDRLGRALTWWFAGQALSMLILGTLMTLGLWFIGVPFALIFGIFTALMTFIPNLGPVIAAIPVLLVALTQGLDVTVYALLLVVIVQNIEGLILTPMVHRRFIAMPPAIVLGALLVLGTLAGFVGVLVAMPLSAVLITIARFWIDRRDAAEG